MGTVSAEQIIEVEMTKILLGGAAAVGILALVFGIGVSVEKNEHQRQLAKAKAAFEQTVREANQAYADQKVIDDKELADLRAQANTAPPNPNIIIKKDMAKRIGAIK